MKSEGNLNFECKNGDRSVPMFDSSALCSLNHDPELCSSSFTFGSENKLSLHSLNHDPELCSSSLTFDIA